MTPKTPEKRPIVADRPDEKKVCGKPELVREVAKKGGLSLKDATQQVDNVFESIKASLTENQSLRLIGFGKFFVKQWGPQTTTNPQTGRLINVPSTNTLKFRMGKTMKKLLNKK